MRRVLLALCCWLAWSSANGSSLFPDDYDRAFQEAAELWLPVGTDWRLLKAQCWQESRLNPFARSPVGAMGLCQFMPGTWRDMQARDGSFTSPWIPEQSIMAAARYMRSLNNFWRAPRPQSDRYRLALASYNAGAGHLVKAQRLAGGASRYDDIIQHLPKVTGRHSRETITYVQLIVDKWYPAMIAE